MLTANEVVVERSIAHQLNPHVVDGVVYSASEMPLSSQPRVVSFLQKHICHSLVHDDLRTAKFQTEGSTHVLKELSHKLIQGKTGFVKGSRLLSEKLEQIMVKNKTISVGTLVVCLYREKAGSDRRVGILKLDPTQTMVQRLETTNGTVVIVWEPTDNAMPATTEDLQKCAFVRIPSVSTDSDLQILDWQKRISREPAKFFTERFLEAILDADEAVLTRTFHTTAAHAIEGMRKELGNAKANAARRVLDAALFQRKVAVSQFVNSLNIPDEQATTLKSKLKSTVSQSFAPDAGVAEKLTNTLKITGKYGLRLRVQREHYDRVVSAESDKTDPQYGTYRELTVRVYDYKQG